MAQPPPPPGPFRNPGLPHKSDFARANPRAVFWGTLACLGLSAVPFLFKTVRDREKNVHRMREESIDAKDDARNSRLRVKG